MSFYWQQALQKQQQQQQNKGYQQQDPQFLSNNPGQWDYINLGGAPAQQYQWNPNQNQNQYHNTHQQPPPQNGMNSQQQYQIQSQWSQGQATPVEHTPLLRQQPLKSAVPNLGNYSIPSSKEVTPEPAQQNWNQTNYQHEQQWNQNQVQSYPTEVKEVTPQPVYQNHQQQQVVEPVPATSYQQWSQPQTQPQVIPSKEVTPEPVVYHGTQIYPTKTPSKEVTPEPAWNQPATAKEVTPEPTWNQPAPAIEPPTPSAPPQEQQFSAPPPPTEKPLTVQPQTQPQPNIEKTQNEIKVTPSSSEDDWEKADLEIQAVEEEQPNGQAEPQVEENSRESSLGGSWSNEQAPQVEESSRRVTPDKPALNLTTSPGEAQATSTPKDLEKRGSVSSQRTLEPEVSAIDTTFTQKKHEEESGNNSDSTLASNQPAIERGSIRASYRNYKQQYTEILKRLNGYRIDKNRADFRPSSKLGNPLLAATESLTGPIRTKSMRNDGRTSVPLPQSQSYNDDLCSESGSHRRHRVSRLDSGRSSVRPQYGYDSSNQSSSAVQQDVRRYQGRHSVMGIPYRNHYGIPAERFSPQYPEGSSLSESDEDEYNEPPNGSYRGYDAEMSYHSNLSQKSQRTLEGPEYYYFGVVHIAIETVQQILEQSPPPESYWALPPMEKAAYMFYAAIYKAQYRDTHEFHKLFNREYFKYVCAGDAPDVALYKVCKSIQDQYVARMQEKQKQAAYEASQKQYLSDDGSQDRYSESASLYENDDVSSSIASGLYFKGPAKFTAPHAFLTFGVGGRTVSVQPDKSISVVNIDDMKSYLKDAGTLKIHDMLYSFKGPLIPNQSPAHTVRLFITKQIEAIKRSDVAMENRYANDVVESLLVWQLLEMMVKQQGNVTGPDIAELLLSASNFKVDTQTAPPTADMELALAQFTSCLLGGHVDEAVDCAIRHGLFTDALILTRRLYPNDPQKVLEIEERFLQTRSMNNPVNTLVSVANGIIPPVITDPLLDDWRTHAAIILANLNQKETAMNTIYQLARALRDRDYHSAADFCFMVVCILAGIDPFVPVKETNGDGFSGNISLVHSAIPDDDGFDLDRDHCGFYITDLQATEIFDYALRLKPERGDSPLSRCVGYQTFRMTYAKLLATHGLTTEAYRYCVEIARSVWNQYTSYKMEDLIDLCDLAESLHYVASADPSEIGWISQLRTMCQTSLYPAQSSIATSTSTSTSTNLNPVQPSTQEQIEPAPVPKIEDPPTPEPPVIKAEENLVDWNAAPIIPEVQEKSEVIEQQMTPYQHHQQPPKEEIVEEPAQWDQGYQQQQQQQEQYQEEIAQPSAAPPVAPIEEPAPPPPPTAQLVAAPPSATTVPTVAAPSGFRAVRGASRYANAGGNAPAAAPAVAPMSFGFMPQAQDDDESFDPFSGQANPTIQQNPTKPSADE